MDGASSFDDYRMPDELWELLEPLLPKYPESSKGGRPRADLRSVADAIFYRLRTGCQWNAIPRELAPGSTAHQYFQEWLEAGVFDLLWQQALTDYDDLVGLDLRWQCVDGAMTKAPLGGQKTGKNPTDRGKQGTKRSLMTDANGIPLGLAVAGANVHDIRLLEQTIDDAWERSPRFEDCIKEHIALDKGYDSKAVREMLETVYGYIAHIKSRGDESKDANRSRRKKARRWVVERTHGWLNRFRGILIRWEKKLQNHIACLHLACAYFTYARSGVFG
jgi:putative transposase